jgi:hypothetical protein
MLEYHLFAELYLTFGVHLIVCILIKAPLSMTNLKQRVIRVRQILDLIVSYKINVSLVKSEFVSINTFECE